MSANSDNKKNAIFDIGKRLFSLYVENIRLSSAEKLTILLSGVALVSISAVLAIISLLFLTISLANLLDDFISPCWSYLIIAGIFMLAIAVLIVFKEQLVINPIARFVSKLLVEPPKKP